MTPGEILKRLRGLKVLVIGDLMLDHYIWGDVHRISPEAPVPVVHATRDTHTAGGAANVALNLAALGVHASVIGVTGEDDSAAILATILEHAGIDTTRCIRRPHAPTVVKTRVIARNQQLCRIDREAPRDRYAIDTHPGIGSLLADAIRSSDAIILSDYAKGIVTQPLIDLVLPIARQFGKIVAIDPKPARRLAFSGIDLLTPNRHEALELAGLPEPAAGEPYPLEEAARRIHETFAPHHLIITLGADGMAVCQEGRVTELLPTLAREVFDVSGAGDTVIATLAAALAAGASAVDAALLANLAAGDVVSKMGTAVPDLTALSQSSA